MSAQRLALQTIKSIEATAQTRSAFKFNRVRNLARLIGSLGFAFLLNDLSPVAAQTLALTEKNKAGNTFSPSVRKTPAKARKIVVRAITGQFYPMRNGELREVFITPQGKRFVYRDNGRKYFPKPLNH